MTHELKCWPEYFAAVNAGDKTFELRKDDRGFELGDEVMLSEWSPITGDYTGAYVAATITFILRDAEKFGLMPGYCILSLVLT